MVMTNSERRTVQAMLDKTFIESDQPTMANLAVFYDENDRMLYSGIIKEWPIIIAVDQEWGEVKEMDTTKEPFTEKKVRRVRFFSPFKGN